MTRNKNDETDLGRLRAVDRALADLRRGLSLIVRGDKEAALILATEMAYDPELSALGARSGETPVLVLTAHRANVLHILPTGDDAVSIRIDDWMDAPMMRGLADMIWPSRCAALLRGSRVPCRPVIPPPSSSPSFRACCRPSWRPRSICNRWRDWPKIMV